MAYFELVLEYMKENPGEYSAPDIVDTLFPDLTRYNRIMMINKVNHALNIGRKFGYFEKLELIENRRYWRLAQ